VQHSISRKHSNKSLKRSAINLEPYIHFEQERITRSRVVFHSVRFNLDREVLQSIQYARDTGRRLDVSPEFLADLRCYALIDPENRLQSDLTFYTYYLEEGSPEAVMRSVISTDGEIFHQIKSDCLEHPDWYCQIVSAHYWLIDQLLSQLRLGRLVYVNRLAQILSWLIAIAVALAFVPLAIEVNPWLLLALVLMAWLLQKIIYKLLRSLLPSFSRWTLRYLLSGLLSHKSLHRKIAKGFLERLES
jgi:hypothetical protein